MKQTYLLCAIVLAQSGCRSPHAGLSALKYKHPKFDSTSLATDTFAATEAGSIEDYVQLGFARNPRIQEAQHKTDAIRHRVPQVLSLPDPMVSTNTHLSPVQTAAGEQAFSLGVILPKAERTLEISIDEYATGSIDYVQLIANWRNVLRYRITKANLQSQFSQLLASLARAVGQLDPIDSQSNFRQPTLEPMNGAETENDDSTDLKLINES